MANVKQLKPKFEAPSKANVSKHLNLDAMMTTAQSKFENIQDHRKRECKISLADALMSGLAMFALKDPSLLNFDNRRNNDEGNLKRVFGIQNVASDSQLREILDPVDPDLIRPMFSDFFLSTATGQGAGASGIL